VAPRGALIVFVRPPVPGTTKTRLARALGDEAAAELYRAFVIDTVRLAVEIGAEVELACAGDPAHPFLAELVERHGLEATRQVEGDLGARMAHALTRGIAAHGRAVIVGSDAPTLPPSLLAGAFAALDHAELVLGPSHDGGYYLLGATRPPRLAPVRWSTAHALDDTLARNPDARSKRLPPWYDVDTPEDLRLLRAHLALDPGRAPATARALARF
jgi:rSAM/selenodomain-associated transferase 1